jgi:FdhD protein
MTVSGRVSFEIVSKAAAIGVQHLIAVSAPSSLAVGLCKQRGITLIGFCREGRFTVYTHPEQVQGGPHG